MADQITATVTAFIDPESREWGFFTITAGADVPQELHDKLLDREWQVHMPDIEQIPPDSALVLKLRVENQNWVVDRVEIVRVDTNAEHD